MTLQQPSRESSPPGSRHEAIDALSEEQYAALAQFRQALRRATAFTDEMLAASGLGPRRYQALLAIRARPTRTGFSVGDLADELIIKPNTAAELANRLENAGLVRRVRDPRDRRRALLELTAEGAARLERVALVNFARLQESRAAFMKLFTTGPGESGQAASRP